MLTINVFLLVLSLVFLVLSAAKIPELPRLSWGWAGLAIWMLVAVLGGIR